MRDWNFGRIEELLVECSVIAKRIKDAPHTVLKDDHTPVSEADIAIEKFLTGALIEGESDVLFIGEETCRDLNREQFLSVLKHGTLWVVDPIDGTANFVNRRSWWGTSIGYIRDGVLREGAVLMPELGDCLISDQGRTFYRTGFSYPSRLELHNSLREAFMPQRPFDESSCYNLSQVLTRRGKFNGRNPMVTTGSAVCAGMDLLLGRDACYATHAKLWDLAGFLPCLRNLGFVSANRSGKNLMSCTLSPELFDLVPESKHLFFLHEMNWIGVSEEAVKYFMDRTEFSESGT